MMEFRVAAAGWYKKRFGVDLDPSKEVLTLIGSKEGIGHTPLAFVNPADVVLYTDPGYPVYKIGTILADGVPQPIPLTSENKFLPDFSKIPKAKLKKAKLLFINYPNNPTAAVADKKFLAEAVDFARENKILVCHDAPYSEITFDGFRAPSILEVEGSMEVAIEYHSLSKTYNMTGWRIGWACGNADAIKGLGKVKQNVDSGAFDAVQEAGVEALNGPQDEYKKNLRTWESRRNLMVAGLSKLGWKVEKPKATFYLWAPVPTKEKSIDFARRVLDECGVVLTPGVGFGEYGEGYVRMALSQTEKRLKEALDRLGKLF
jgi:LL-diaminopimelate aminotransferase